MVMDIVQALAITTEAPRDKDMAMEAITRGLLHLVMDTVESATITEAPKVSKDMDITRGLQLLSLDMALLMSMLNRRIMDMDTLSLMNMATTSTRGPLMLDMNPTKVTRKFPTPHTPTMRSKCTTLTKCQIEIVPELLIYVNDSYFIRIKI